MTTPLDTGEQIAAALRAAAAEKKLPLLHFIRPLTAQPLSWLRQVQMARLPTRRTRDRVRALLAGEPLPRTIDPNPLRERTAPRRRPAPDAIMEQEPPLTARVDREPCFHCGVRADVGCHHRPWTTEAGR